MPTALDLKSFLPEELVPLLDALGAPSYRARQVFGWLHRRLAADFAAMTDLPAGLREALAAEYRVTTLKTVETDVAGDGTTKLLFRLPDSHTIETVRIPEDTRLTVCVSTMVGCPFGCGFCATGQGGFERNLTAGEIVDQVYRVQAASPETRVSNVVFMGMGEPLANYDATLRAVRLLMHPQGLNLSARRLTLSTVGIIPGIERLADEGLGVNLAVSLHAPTQAERVKLVPIAKKYPLDSLMAAVRQYVHRTGRKVTFEYTVVPGQNDRPEDAAALAALVRRLQCVVNVIPLNPTLGMPPRLRIDRAALHQAAARFADALRTHGVEVALRRSRGSEVGGACGQLRHSRG